MIKLEVLTSPTCTYCSAAKIRINKVVEEMRQSRNITIKEINVTEHPEIMLKYGVRATPAIAINGRLVYIGLPTEREIAKLVNEAAGAEP